MRACMRSWFFLSSSWLKVSSLIFLSDLRRFFWLSAIRLFSASISDSSSLMRVSILVMAFLPPLRALVWASSTLACMSLTWASSSLLSLSRAWASSCSDLSSSARRAASIMARWAFSSDRDASPAISSQSACRVWISDSSFISQAGGVNHGALGLLLGQGCLSGHLVTVGLQGLDLRLELHLGSLDGLVGAGLVRQRLVSVLQLLLDHAAGAVGLLKQGAGLLQSILVGIGLPFGVDELVMGDLLGSLLLLELGLGLPQLELVALDGPLGVGIGSVGALKVALKVQDVSLEFLLHPEGLGLSLGLSLDSGLHVLDGLGHVLPGGEELLVLLGHAALDLLSDLGELQLAPQHLVLLLLQGTLSLGQSSLELHLLSLEPLADFVNLVDGAASLADLIEDVLDLVAQSLVLPPDLIQLEHSLVVGVLHLEQFRRDTAGLILSTIKIH